MADSRNAGLHFQLDANASVISLGSQGGNNGKIGFFATPEARFKFGWGDGHGVFAGFGYKQIGQFTDNKTYSNVIEDATITEHTNTIGYTFNIGEKTNSDYIKWGFDSFVVGVGRGTFKISENNYTRGNFIFLGFTVNIVDLWIIKDN